MARFMNTENRPFDWPHAPVHRLGELGAYMVTAGTYGKEHFFARAERLNYLTKALLVLAAEHGWDLQAWAVFPNHYHFVAQTDKPTTLSRLIQYLHSVSAKYVNRLDGKPCRKVWHQYWDSHLSYHNSFLARLNYVHTNPVRHKLVHDAENYEWCSAGWFARTAPKSFYNTVVAFRSDRINIPDDY
jgi:putative transposase